MKKKLNAEELRAVKLYEGDVPAGTDPFWCKKAAYVSLNALMFRGLTSEYTRIAEGKRLNTAVFADIPRLLSVYEALSTAAWKCAAEEPMVGFRVERQWDFFACSEAGRTLAFTSACTDTYLQSYGDKHGIVQLRYSIPAGTPCILFRDALDVYLKCSENEVLLPPQLNFTVDTIVPLKNQRLGLVDLDGRLATGIYALRVTGVAEPPQNVPFSEQTPEAGIAVWEAINAGKREEEIPQELRDEFEAWKRGLQARVAQMISR